jgi:hypothetical protein
VQAGTSTYQRSYPFTYTISSANTWQQVTIPITGDTVANAMPATNGAAIRVEFYSMISSGFANGTANTWNANTGTNQFSSSTGTNLFATNGNTWQVTGVQIELGSQATSFDFRSYGTELALCQRYLPAFSAANGGTLGAFGTGGFYTTTDAAIGIPFPVTARVAPTGISVANVGYFQIDGITSAATTSATISSTSTSMGGVNFGYATSTTLGSFARARFNNAAGTLLFTGCEL